MFTGIIEDIGKIKAIRQGANSMVLTLSSGKITEDMRLGDSISVNGVCLTVTSFSGEDFTVDVMPETVKATSLRSLRVGSSVNLERAMSANGRFGGHFVTGHVDGTGTIVKKERKENAVYYVIDIGETLAKNCIPRGSIALDGTSLTIFGLEGNIATVSLIPLTHQETVLGMKQAGDIVNVETDMIGKYIFRSMEQTNKKQTLTMDFLAEHGY
ncbi:riboflavin synthase [Peribacillus saganii]|uniref:Riboflavin synthase n=1 Tax=Peribacillus saganii TaxID=2303992 RepID=A0A372LLV5_9BACI|nr:riboflavin synthase [Peribacillus saganii]RFU67917.1 riboflavin synthase [Peribacillus saganii]